MGKKERDEFIAKNDLDVLRIKKAFFVIVYIGMFIILLSIVNTLYISLARANYDNTNYLHISAIDRYNYSFYTDVFYNETTPISLQSSNNYLETTYELPYNATYTFTGETGGVISDWTEDETGGSIHYDTYLNGHDYIVHLDDNGAGTPKLYQDFASDQTSGTIAFWMLNVDATILVNARFYENGYGGTMPFRMSIQTEQLRFFDGASWISIGGALDNMWYHTNIDFDTTIDEVNVSINGVRVLTDQSVVDVANVGGIAFLTTYTDSADLYLDAIDYSWDSNYSSFRSLYGITNYTGISQTAFWDFYHTEDGNYSTYIEPIPFWTKINGGGSGYTYCMNGEIWTYTHYIADGIHGIYHDFTAESGFINVTWREKIDDMFDAERSDPNTQPNAWYGMSIFSDSDALLTQVNISYQDNVYYLQAHNGSEFVNLTSGLQEEEFYNFSLYTDGSTVILSFNDTETYQFSTMGFSEGLGQVRFTQKQTENDETYRNTDRKIDYIGVYVNGTSLSDDYRSVILDLNESVYIPKKHPYLDINVSGNYSLSIADDVNTYLIASYGQYNNSVETYDLYDFDGDPIVSEPPPFIYNSYNPYLIFTTNESLTATSIVFYSGIILTDGTNDFYSQTYYSSNFTSNDISFSTNTNGSLIYTANYNRSLNQYMYYSFDLNLLYLYDYVLSTTGLTNATGGFITLSVNYMTGNPSNFTFDNIVTSYTQYLTNRRTMFRFIIEISDDNNYNFNSSIAGRLNNFTIGYVRYLPPILPQADNWVSLIIITASVFPFPIIIFTRVKKRYPEEKHDMLKYLIPAVIGCVISTALYFGNPLIMPLFVYITLFVGFFLLILPSMVNRYLTLSLMFVSIMVYGGYFPAWVYIINLLIVSFTTILAVKNMNLGDK